MSTFRPVTQHQGPASHCIIDGQQLGWKSCSSYGMAMLIDRSTLGRKQPSGCAVRRGTGDTVGGLTLPQVALVAERDYGVKVEKHVGSSVCTPAYAASQLKKGRSEGLQGNTKPLIGTRHASTSTPVNHFVFLNEGRDFGSGVIPKEVLVYDPAADGRRASIDESPSWWKWSEVLAFAAALRPWGDEDPRTLGKGWWYVGIGPDTEPHVVLRYGAHQTIPFPDKTRFHDDIVHVHNQPKSGLASVVATARDRQGEVWWVYQRVTNADGTWNGNADGTRWINGDQLDYEGGST